jgi:hypothetical protein
MTYPNAAPSDPYTAALKGARSNRKNAVGELLSVPVSTQAGQAEKNNRGLWSQTCGVNQSPAAKR